jgi:hypothetical protein
MLPHRRQVQHRGWKQPQFAATGLSRWISFGWDKEKFTDYFFDAGAETPGAILKIRSAFE